MEESCVGAARRPSTASQGGVRESDKSMPPASSGRQACARRREPSRLQHAARGTASHCSGVSPRWIVWNLLEYCQDAGVGRLNPGIGYKLVVMQWLGSVNLYYLLLHFVRRSILPFRERREITIREENVVKPSSQSCYLKSRRCKSQHA